jgi:hypothetical protein
VHVIGLSILSGSHITLVQEVLERLRAAGSMCRWWWAASCRRKMQSA